MQLYAIPCTIANFTKKHVSEDDILFTKPLAGKGLMVIFLQVEMHVDVIRCNVDNNRVAVFPV